MSHFRTDLARIGEQTAEILDRGVYVVDGKTVEIAPAMNKSIHHSILFKPDDLQVELEMPVSEVRTAIETTGETTLAAAKRLKDEGCDRVIALNFASAKHPGGGWLTGATAQEESLARASALFPTINQFQQMYKHNLACGTALYSDYMIYSPEVPVFRNDDGTLLDEYHTVSFITSPAPNAGVVERNESHSKNRINAVLKTRIEKILRLAVLKGYRAIVLGAFGCGVFQNNPNAVAMHFNSFLRSSQFRGEFERVVFAVYDRTPKQAVYRIFKNILG